MSLRTYWFRPVCGSGLTTRSHVGALAACWGRRSLGGHLATCMLSCGTSNGDGRRHMERLKAEFAAGRLPALDVLRLSVERRFAAAKAYRASFTSRFSRRRTMPSPLPRAPASPAPPGIVCRAIAGGRDQPRHGSIVGDDAPLRPFASKPERAVRRVAGRPRPTLRPI